MKKLLWITFLFVYNHASANANIDQMSTCAMTNFVSSKRFESKGNMQMKNKYSSEAQYWLNAGESKFGENAFTQKIKIVGPNANAASDAELAQINTNCATLKISQ